MTCPNEHLDVARSSATSADELRALARSPHDAVRVAVAAHPRTEPDVLEALLPASVNSAGDRELIEALAANPNAPETLLTALLARLVPILESDDPEPAIPAGVAACSHASTPLAAIESLLEEPDMPRDFRKTVARETPRRDVLELLAADRSGKVRKWAMTRLARQE